MTKTILNNNLARYVTPECHHANHDRCSRAVPLRGGETAWPCTCPCHADYNIVSDEALAYEQALATVTAQRDALLAALEALLARMTLIRLSRPEPDWPEAHATAMSEASTVIAAVKGDA